MTTLGFELAQDASAPADDSGHTEPLDILLVALEATECDTCREIRGLLVILKAHLEDDVPAWYARRAA